MKNIFTILIILLIAACQNSNSPKQENNRISIENRNIINYGMNNALDNKLSGEIYKWKSSQSNLITTIIPLNTYSMDNKKCRDFIEIINITGLDNPNPISYGIKSACKATDLPWIIREN